MKAKVRLNAMTSAEQEISWSEGETFSDIHSSVCHEFSVPEEIAEHLYLVCNGTLVDPSEMSKTPDSKDNIMVAVVPAGGSGRGIFKQVVVLAAVAAGSAFGGPWGGAAAGLAAGLLMNFLMPEPIPGKPSLGGADDAAGVESSQMYSVTAQSNQTKKYQGVPKVFGTFRMYPFVAANAYTVLDVDQSTGELVQYMYAIYDFGFGPMVVDDIKIGETLITDYADVDYRLVDPNMPSYAEGDVKPEWDANLFSTFQNYKGDGEALPLSISITKNKEEVGVAEEDYSAVRAALGQNSGDDQEITVQLVCPRGLDTIGSDGKHYTRNVELTVDYAEVGTENWISYSDIVNTAGSPRVVGGQDSTRSAVVGYYPPELVYPQFGSTKAYYRNITTTTTDTTYRRDKVRHIRQSDHAFRDILVDSYEYRVSGFIEEGTSEVIAKSGIPNLSLLKINGKDIGAIVSEVSIGGGYSTYVLENPTPYRIDLYFATMLRQISDPTIPLFTEDTGWVPKDNTTSAASVEYVYQSGSLVTLSGSTSDPLYCSISFRPLNIANYKVRVVRNRSYGGQTYIIQDDLVWASLEARFDRSPIATEKRHTFLELKIRATNQLSGSISKLSGVITSVLDIYDDNTGEWSLGKTSNPAWIYADLLTGQMNKRAIDKSRLDVNSIVEWSEYCDETPPPNPEFPDEIPGQRFKTNFVLDYVSTLQEVINQVSHSCQASMSLIDGKYGVLIDRSRTIPVQLFTERNSWNFSSVRQYADKIHGYKVKYSDPQTWQVSEVIVYSDGYDETNAEKLEEINTFGCTDPTQAWRYGRFMLAQSELRREVITIDVDFEYLVCTRGDFVQLTSSVMKVGGMSSRVIWADGNQIRIDAKFSPEMGKDYGYTYRPVDGDITTSTLTITSPDTATVDGPIPEVGHLIVWGEVGKTTFDCLVRDITPTSGLGATLTLIERADAVYDAESTGEIPAYDPQLSQTTTEDQAPNKVNDLQVTDNSFVCTGYNYEYFIDLFWLVPQGSVYESFEVYVDYGGGFTLVEPITSVGYRYQALPLNVNVEHKFKVIAVSSSGAKLGLTDVDTVSATPLTKTANPSDVLELNLNVTGELVQIEWPAVTDCDILEYLIRFSPVDTGSWEESIPLQRADKRTTSVSVQARTGSYFIKAIDFNGNESTAAAKAITSIPGLTNLNIIDETNDFPALLGEKDRVEKVGDTIMLQEVAADE